MRAIELFSGIGGFTAAVQDVATVVAAFDHNRPAFEVYTENWGDHCLPKNLQYYPLEQLNRFEPELLWMSPPCQPYTTRGNQRDLDDPRAVSFVRIVDAIRSGILRPDHLAMENVAGFVGSRGHAAIREVLDESGYEVIERVLCPTELGIPNRRPRFYLVASLLGVAEPELRRVRQPLAAYLEPDHEELLVREERIIRFAPSMHLVSSNDPDAVAATFTSAYGKSPVAAGSYVSTVDGPRFLSPQEMLRLLHFPAGFRLPDWPPRQLYKLIGNSLNVEAVRTMLTALPALRERFRAKVT